MCVEPTVRPRKNPQSSAQPSFGLRTRIGRRVVVDVLDAGARLGRGSATVELR
jgi:hypothetical protein